MQRMPYKLQVSFRKRATNYRALLRDDLSRYGILWVIATLSRELELFLQVSFRKRATNYRALLREMTYQDTVIATLSRELELCFQNLR